MSRTKPTRQSVRRRVMTAAGAAGLAAVLAAPTTASAGIWTPVASGTTDTITALDYRPDRLVFGTTTGKIHVVGAGLRRQFPGLSVTDVDVSPNGVTAIATFSGGFQSRSTDGGMTWGDAMSVNSYRPMQSTCAGAPEVPVAATPIGQDATSVTWASDTVAYMTTNLRHSLLKTTDAGASWQELNRQPNGTCAWGNNTDVMTDVAPVVGSNSVYLINRDFGRTYFSANALSTAPSQRAGAVNCFTAQPSLAVDTGDPSRLLAGDRCFGRINMPSSNNSATSWNNLVDVVPSSATVEGIHDVAYTGGTGIWVGKGGNIFTTLNGATAYYQPADGALATSEWRAVESYGAGNAAVAGSDGALVISGIANTIPAPAATPTPTPTPSPAPGTGTGTVPGTTPGGTTTSVLPGGGGILTLTGPAACVASGAEFKATMKMRKLQIKNNKIVKLTRVDFYLNGKRVKIDRKAPFTQKITVPASAPKTIHTLKAKGFVKVKKGKAPKRTQTVKFSVC